MCTLLCYGALSVHLLSPVKMELCGILNYVQCVFNSYSYPFYFKLTLRIFTEGVACSFKYTERFVCASCVIESVRSVSPSAGCFGSQSLQALMNECIGHVIGKPHSPVTGLYLGKAAVTASLPEPAGTGECPPRRRRRLQWWCGPVRIFQKMAVKVRGVRYVHRALYSPNPAKEENAGPGFPCWPATL